MKRLIPAGIIFILTITICILSNIYVTQLCNQTITQAQKYYSNNISADSLKKFWKTQKEKLSFFVNHKFLDDVSINIDQLTAEKSNAIFNNIKSIMDLIKSEQHLTPNSFY